MKLHLVLLAVALSSPGFAGNAEDNQKGFQAARSLTSEAMGDKPEGKSGKVTDVIDVQNYTYVELTSGKDKTWLATSKTAVKKGDVVSFSDGQAMHKFHSKSLNRTFDEIYFVNSVQVRR